jgi:hypothetical protein
VLIYKMELEVYDKIKLITKGAGVIACGIIHHLCTDVSTLGLAEQARTFMHPDPQKREEDLAEHMEMWQDEMRRLEAHENEFKPAPCSKSTRRGCS